MLILKNVEKVIFGSIILCTAILTITANGDLWEVMGWLEDYEEETPEEEEIENEEALIKLFTLTTISIASIIGSLISEQSSD